MQIHLTKDQEDWLQPQVAAGRFSSLEEALAEAIDSLRAEDEALAWATPLVDEGLAELDRGESIPAEKVFASLSASRAKESIPPSTSRAWPSYILTPVEGTPVPLPWQTHPCGWNQKPA